MTDPLTQDLLIAMKTNLLSKCSPVFSLVIATMQCLAFHGAPSHGAEPKSFELRLWESGAPDAKGSEPKDIPMAMVRLPESQKPTGAVVVCPGGGYGTLAMGHEGHEIAAWLNKNGIAAIICDYRHRSKRPTGTDLATHRWLSKISVRLLVRPKNIMNAACL